jgi:hypothetical protein
LTSGIVNAPFVDTSGSWSSWVTGSRSLNQSNNSVEGHF